MTDLADLSTPRETARAALAAFCPILAEVGIDQVVIAYDGGGDEGQIHEVSAYAKGALVALPEGTCLRHQSRFNGTIEIDTASVASALDAFGYAMIRAEGCSFHGTGDALDRALAHARGDSAGGVAVAAYEPGQGLSFLNTEAGFGPPAAATVFDDIIAALDADALD